MELLQRPVDAQPRKVLLALRSTWKLWLYGLVMALPMIYFARRYPLLGNSNQLLDIGKMSNYEREAFVAFIRSIVVLFAGYVLALRETRRLPARLAFPAVFSCGSALAYIMTWMYPVNAIDIFHYALRSRLLTTYGANPLVALFKDYPRDAWVPFSHQQWAKMESPYGPLWNLIAAPFTYIAGDNIAVALVGFKVLALFCFLACGWIIYRTLTATSSPHAATGALFFLWNPLVLWEAVGNGHNDVVMTLPLLLAMYAWVKRRDTLVLPLIVVAALIKYVPALLIPVALVALWRRADGWPARRRLLAWSVGLSVLAVGIALFPFYDFDAVLSSVARQGNMLRMSLAGVLYGNLHTTYGGAAVKHWARYACLGILLITLAWQARVLWRRPLHLPRAAFEITFVFLLLVIWYFNPWYLILPVALAALLPWGWPAWRMIAWSIGAMASYGLVIWVEAWWKPDFYTLQNVGVALIAGPTLLLTLVDILRGRDRGGSGGLAVSANGGMTAADAPVLSRGRNWSEYKQLLARWQWTTYPLLLFIGTRIALLVFSYMSLKLVPDLNWEFANRDFLKQYPALDGLCRWDCWHLARIAQSGYTEARWTNFFPLYPLLVRVVQEVTGIHADFALLLVPNLASLGAYLVIYRIFVMLADEAGARWGLALFAAFPFAFFQATGYPESLMLFFGALAVLLALRGNHVWAGVALGVGVLARHLTMFTGAALLAAQIRQRGLHPKRLLLNPAILGLFVPWLFLGLYLLYQYLTFGDAMAFAEARDKPPWGPFSWWGITDLLATNRNNDHIQAMYSYIPFALITTIGSLALLARRQWIELAAFSIIFMLVLWQVGMWGLGRYSASCWPAFLPLGVWLAKRPHLQGVAIAVLALFQGLFFYLFVHMYAIL